MKKRIITLLFVIVGGSLGAAYLPAVWTMTGMQADLLRAPIFNVIIGAIIFFILSFLFRTWILALLNYLEKLLKQVSVSYLVFALTGLLVGLIAAWLVNIPLSGLQIPLISQALPFVIAVLFGYLGIFIATTRMEDFKRVMLRVRRKSDDELMKGKQAKEETQRKYKILDTSVIIDGRILDIAKTGFIEGVLVIPNFVLMELQYIADSSDHLKRVRGRRGLDTLNAMQKEARIHIESYDGDFEDVAEVDSKLIYLAKKIDGIIITNDFNLSKVCEFQSVPVLNINLLANAVKPVVIPGERLIVQVIKAGTERQQGVAYLDDGTMIVVEEGQLYMNETIEVEVTSVLQTAAGRMIFAKLATVVSD